ncbi:hypothetical protein FB446DRAFT_823931 [Lentinula raphanica]|nr:hypothetical protein FB446DRAFT_823931 [Lentinula raphanica]
MGWDPTVEFSHYSQSGRRQYKIEVDGQKFTTVDVLSDASAARPLGRATRVWKVLDSSGIIRVLKDVWLESDRMGEHEIHQAILDDCRVPVNREPDDTAAVMLHGYDLSKSVQPDWTNINVARRRARNHDHHHHRYHYRIVFEQCAINIYDERNLGNIISALVDIVLVVLMVLHRIGWIHRYKRRKCLLVDGNMGLLGDFEYATRINDQRQHNVRTGTPFFMAAEVISNCYLFTSSRINLEELMGEEKEEEEEDLFNKVLIQKAVEAPTTAMDSLTILFMIWSPSGGSSSTFSFSMITNVNMLKKLRLQHLSPSFAPAVELLVHLGDLLTDAYEQSEKTYPKISDQFFNIYHCFAKLLLSADYINPLSRIMLVSVKDNGKKKRTKPELLEMQRPAKRSPRTSVRCTSVSKNQGINIEKRQEQ